VSSQLLYCLEVCPLNKSDLRSLHFTVTNFLAKLFQTSSRDVINVCCSYFNIKLPSEILPARFDWFIFNSAAEELIILIIINCAIKIGHIMVPISYNWFKFSHCVINSRLWLWLHYGPRLIEQHWQTVPTNWSTDLTPLRSTADRTTLTDSSYQLIYWQYFRDED